MGKRWAKGNYCDIIPDVLFGVDLSNCCYEHDIAYWKKPITRKLADLRLKSCVNNRYRMAGKAKLGKKVCRVIYFFLRILGWIRWYEVDEKVLRFFKRIKLRRLNMVKEKIVPAGKIDVAGLKKVGRGALVAAGGAFLTFLAEAIPGIDFGEWTPVAVAVGGILVNLGRKFLSNYKI